MLVFAYGSLLWHPGFQPKESIPATAVDRRRSWCVQSTVYRGTAQTPGAVLGLIEGGRCSGLLYSVESCDCGRVAEYLHSREMAETGYRPEIIDVETSSGVASALTYVSDPSQRLDTPPERILGIIMRARGISGSNAEYAGRTLETIQELGMSLEEDEVGFPSEIVMTIMKARAITQMIDNHCVNRLPEAELA